MQTMRSWIRKVIIDRWIRDYQKKEQARIRLLSETISESLVQLSTFAYLCGESEHIVRTWAENNVILTIEVNGVLYLPGFYMLRILTDPVRGLQLAPLGAMPLTPDQISRRHISYTTDFSFNETGSDTVNSR